MSILFKGYEIPWVRRFKLAGIGFEVHSISPNNIAEYIPALFDHQMSPVH